MLNEIDKGRTSLLIVHGEGLQETAARILSHFEKKGYSGVYISLNVPHTTMEKLFDKNHIKPENVYFIDCVTAMVHSMPHKKLKNVLYADNPSELAKEGKVPKAIAQFIMSVPGKHFIIVDALRTMLLYNEPELVSGFVESLINNFGKLEAKIVVMTRGEHDDELIKEISGYFDNIIEK